MRRGIADLHRRAEVSRKAAERHLDAFASVEEETTWEELSGRLGQPRQWRGRRVRALRPFGDDSTLLEAIGRGEFAVNGFRNRDLQAIFYPHPARSHQEARRRSGWVSRKLRLLQAHGLITKVNGTHRYQLSASGRKAATAILTALRATVRQLIPMPQAACKSSREGKIPLVSSTESGAGRGNQRCRRSQADRSHASAGACRQEPLGLNPKVAARRTGRIAATGTTSPPAWR
jgi:hypothetical protein